MRMLRNPVMTEPCVLVLGMFDGVHRGHQELLRVGRQLADEHELPLYVCTFEPHPVAVLFPEKTPPRLTTPTQRAQLMQRYGVDALCVTSFTRTYAAMPPEDFVANMAAVYQPRYVVSGFNFTFGDRGRGNAETLLALQHRYGYETITVPAVELEGDVVSSTRIRRLLSAGDVPAAVRLLGHEYSICGCVMHGRQNSRSIGMPTVNLAVRDDQALPADGAYACRVTLCGETRQRCAMVYVEQTASQTGSEPLAEAYILDETLTQYGAQACVTFLQQLRPAQPMAGGEEQQAKNAQDIAAARAYFELNQ